MFTHFKNIDAAFKYVRLFSLCFMLGCLLLCLYSIYASYRVVETSGQKIYVLYNGKAIEALAVDRKSYLPVELRDHIRNFHQFFFSLIPQDKAITSNIRKALDLADESAKHQYDNLRESGYFNNLIAANVSQEIAIDSIKLDIDRYPYSFICYATQKLIRSSNTTTRRLVTRGQVRDLKKQTDENPHGFLIQNWDILENVDLPVRK